VVGQAIGGGTSTTFPNGGGNTTVLFPPVT